MVKLLRALVPGLLLFGADQALKEWSRLNLGLLEQKTIFGQQFLGLYRFHNHGLMMNKFSNYPEGYIEPYTLYGPSLVWLALVLIAATRFRQAGSGERVAYGLMLASGFSNLFDHWRNGFVVDTLQLAIGRGSWLPFNLADAGLMFGASTLVFLMGREVWKDFADPLVEEASIH